MDTITQSNEEQLVTFVKEDVVQCCVKSAYEHREMCQLVTGRLTVKRSRVVHTGERVIPVKSWRGTCELCEQVQVNGQSCVKRDTSFEQICDEVVPQVEQRAWHVHENCNEVKSETADTGKEEKVKEEVVRLSLKLSTGEECDSGGEQLQCLKEIPMNYINTEMDQKVDTGQEQIVRPSLKLREATQCELLNIMPIDVIKSEVGTRLTQNHMRTQNSRVESFLGRNDNICVEQGKHEVIPLVLKSTRHSCKCLPKVELDLQLQSDISGEQYESGRELSRCLNVMSMNQRKTEVNERFVRSSLQWSGGDRYGSGGDPQCLNEMSINHIKSEVYERFHTAREEIRESSLKVSGGRHPELFTVMSIDQIKTEVNTQLTEHEMTNGMMYSLDFDEKGMKAENECDTCQVTSLDDELEEKSAGEYAGTYVSCKQR